MKFFFPDSQDLVDPSFDFATETRSESRLRQRDDKYAHEIFPRPPYDGLLISKAIVDGTAAGAGKYTLAQRHRLLRLGAAEFFRLPRESSLTTMGDCGAFSYIREERPPYSVDDVIDFYDAARFDQGLSVDHVIVDYDPSLDPNDSVPAGLRFRQDVTLELAEEFLRRHRARRCSFHPIGIAQGWSPISYAFAVSALQRMGYTHIALGGMVPLRTPEIRDVVRGVSEIRASKTTFHLLGVNRFEHVNEFAGLGVTSFDSTSPLRRAFKDDKDNYFTMDTAYTAIRVPQVDANTKLQRRVVAGAVNQGAARSLERECLDLLGRYDSGKAKLDDVLDALRRYEVVFDGRKDRSDAYRRTLTDRAWQKCECAICQQLGINVVVFRGAERNRRRGFHNVEIAYRQVHRELTSAKLNHRRSRRTRKVAR